MLQDTFLLQPDDQLPFQGADLVSTTLDFAEEGGEPDLFAGMFQGIDSPMQSVRGADGERTRKFFHESWLRFISVGPTSAITGFTVGTFPKSESNILSVL